VRETQGLPRVARELGRLFGEPIVEAAFAEQAEGVHAMRKRGALGVSRASGLLVPASLAAPALPSHTFHGE
jgi:hypothetical protein